MNDDSGYGRDVVRSFALIALMIACTHDVPVSPQPPPAATYAYAMTVDARSVHYSTAGDTLYAGMVVTRQRADSGAADTATRPVAGVTLAASDTTVVASSLKTDSGGRANVVWRVPIRSDTVSRVTISYDPADAVAIASVTLQSVATIRGAYVGTDGSALGLSEVDGPDQLAGTGTIGGRSFALHAEAVDSVTWAGELTWEGGLVDDVSIEAFAHDQQGGALLKVEGWTRPPCVGGARCVHADAVREVSGVFYNRGE